MANIFMIDVRALLTRQVILIGLSLDQFYQLEYVGTTCFGKNTNKIVDHRETRRLFQVYGK